MLAPQAVGMMAPQAGTMQPWQPQGDGSWEETMKRMEGEFGEQVNYLYNALTDLNQPQVSVMVQVQKVMAMRDRILSMWGMPSGASGKAAGAGWGRPVDSAWNGQEWNFKGKLQTLITRKKGSPLLPGELVYETGPGEDGKFISSVWSAGFLAEGYTSPQMPSKKAAEAAAAYAALVAEFDEDPSLQETIAETGRMPGCSTTSGASKRKRAGTAQAGIPGADPIRQDAKNRANHGVQLLLGRSVAKGEIIYDVQESDGMFLCKLTVETLFPGQVFEGAPAADRKTAELNAAEIFLDTHQGQFDSAQQELKRKREQAVEDAKARKLLREAEKAAGGGAPSEALGGPGAPVGLGLM